ncbi:conjugal transfer protein TraE [Lonsdalea populi]|uniref:conjugal transfer protein TraE n=1 Tax=Lonsdalea populi TaxID=1172565 RepID=UPI000A1EE80A|nr:conjugal transfer protein TraE [Lonsdalea populi]OSN01284.1 conjugal transfer protein TraE [Lonsdalea populi]QPQ24987.1 conjugal transfer protein TraE [Lonsdalea populi]RAT43957.1 conjugal transfer protein TraE [Lonsdalea populi]RAT45112.1 conjugal transfer protein TraE [Lonsdalea populi]RAT57534.1 conjugal transfer protein TraE [Lonsdalea populi]
MNHKNITTLISRIALEQDEEVQQLVRQFSEGKRTGGTPMGIRFRPVVREFITRVSQKIGISAAELVNILVEGVMIETFAPRLSMVRCIYDRFWLLMGAHRLSMVTVATLLTDVNMGLSVLENRERTLDYLTTPVINQLADWFGVTPEWIECTDDHPVEPVILPNWQEVYKYLTSNSDIQPNITLVRRDKKMMEGSCENNDVVICISRMRKVNGISFRVIEFTGVMRKTNAEIKETDSFIESCEAMRKASQLTSFECLDAPEHLFTKLATGVEIPISILTAINNYKGRKYRNPNK